MTAEAHCQPVLVTGAAGKTGTAICEALVRAGVAVRAWVFREQQRAALEALGVSEVIAGSFQQRGLAKAAVGQCRAIYHLAPNMHLAEVEIAETMIEAARGQGVKRFVYHSVLHPQVEAMPHHRRKSRVEELLFASDLESTILQPAAYMQNLLSQKSQILQEGYFEVPFSLLSRVALVDLEDVAEVATKVLTESGHEWASYELCGEGASNQLELADCLSRVLGTAVSAREITHEAWAEGVAAVGMPRAVLESFLAMFRYYDQHGMRGNTRTLAMLLGRAPSTFERVTERWLAANSS